MKRALLAAGIFIVVLLGLSLLIGSDRRVPKNIASSMVKSVMLDSGAQIATLTATEDLRLDGTEKSFVSMQGGIQVAPNGNIVVPQTQDHNFRFFAPDGREIGTLGGKGSGPGEFAGNWQRMGWKGDTLWIWDYNARRLTYANSDGTYIDDESFSFLFTAPRDLGRFPAFFADVTVMGLHGERYLVTASAPTSMRPKAWTYRHPLLSIGSMGMVHGAVAEFGTLGDSDMVSYSEQPGNRISVVLPLRVMPLEAVGADGARIAMVTTHIAGLTGGSIRVVVLSDLGDTLMARNLGFIGAPISKHAVDSAIAVRVKDLKVPQLADLVREETPRRMHPVFAPLRDVRLGRDSTVWLRLRTTLAQQVWLILDANGDPVGRVALPENLTLYVADRRNIWTTTWDDDDVPSVVRYRLSGWGEGTRGREKQ